MSKLLDLDASDPLRLAPFLLETLLRQSVNSSPAPVSSSSTPPVSASDLIAKFGSKYEKRAGWAYCSALHAFMQASAGVGRPDAEEG